MAFIETLFDYIEVNVGQSVGRGGINDVGDVVVVQTFLNYVCRGRPFFSNYAFTEPSGQMDKETLALIKRYQQFMRHRIKETVSIDGRVSRAKGITAFGTKGRYTIRSLNSEAALLHFLDTKGTTANYLVDMIWQYPIMGQYLPPAPVGTLNLALEGDTRIPGTLNMSLE